MPRTHRSAIVTGASSGIGRATAIALAKEGYSVILNGRDADRLAAALASVQQANADAIHTAVTGDVVDASVCEQLIEAATRTTDGVDVLCNIAGYARLSSVAETLDRHWQKMYEVNVFAPARLTRLAWGSFQKQNDGCVVNVSSLASFDPFPGLGIYGSAKAALNMLTLVTAREGNRIGVRAVSIAPGAVETPMLRSAFDEEIIPKSAALEPEAVAQLICDCVERRRAFEPGGVIRIEPEIE